MSAALELQRQEFQYLVPAGLTLLPKKPREMRPPASTAAGEETLSAGLASLPAAAREARGLCVPAGQARRLEGARSGKTL